MSTDELGVLVGQVVESLPKEIWRRVGPLVIDVEDEPTFEMLCQLGLKNQTIDGVCIISVGMMPRIVLYAGPIGRSCTSDQFPSTVRRVVLHELGHALGLTEKEVHELGLAAPSLLEETAITIKPGTPSRRLQC
jgi:predicted Zn-dependent protease with MMP-like domain